MLGLPPELYQLLRSWGMWCRGSATNPQMAVACQSIEARYLPWRGDVSETVETVLMRQIRRFDRPPDALMGQVEATVMRLPGKFPLALRLEFWAYKSMPISRKRRLLGVTEDAYWDMVRRAAFMVRNRMGAKIS